MVELMVEKETKEFWSRKCSEGVKGEEDETGSETTVFGHGGLKALHRQVFTLGLSMGMSRCGEWCRSLAA